MDETKALLDRDQIRDRIVRVARGEDRRDADLITSSYWPDSAVDQGLFQGSFEDYLGWVVPGADAITDTQHVLGQTLIELDGDTARAETYVVAHHRVDMGEGERDTCIGGRYLDVFAKRGAEWRIAQRTMLYDWYQDWGQAADWSQGLMGMPFSADHYSGRAHGDHSETFFTKR